MWFRYKLARTVTSHRSTNYSGNEDLIECIACQRLFFVSPFLLS